MRLALLVLVSFLALVGVSQAAKAPSPPAPVIQPGPGDECAIVELNCGGFNPHAYDSGCGLSPVTLPGWPPNNTYQCWNPWNGWHLHIWF
jgi:hypothetical protein